MIDFHLHTTASDGILSLEQLIEEAKRVRLKAIAITDHDTILSAKQIPLLDPKPSIEVIPGVELSIYDDKLSYVDLHILGLFIDPKSKKLNTTLERLERDRQNQKKAIVKKLNELGYSITYEDAKKKAKGSVGRPHIARALIEKYPDEFTNVGSVFEKLLDQRKPAFVSRTDFFSLKEAIETIHISGGIAILAHPGFYKYDLDRLLVDFKQFGGDGIETVYDYAANSVWRGYTEKDNARLRKEIQLTASKMGFLESGGSDFHGPNKGAKLGTLDVPDEFLTKMKKRVCK